MQVNEVTESDIPDSESEANGEKRRNKRKRNISEVANTKDGTNIPIATYLLPSMLIATYLLPSMLQIACYLFATYI